MLTLGHGTVENNAQAFPGAFRMRDCDGRWYGRSSLMLRYVNIARLNEAVEESAGSFQNAYPFKHVVFEDLLVPGRDRELMTVFPTDQWAGWEDADSQYQRQKRRCYRIGLMPEPLDRLLLELNSGEFISWLERLTGIRELLPDPHLQGGGLHSTPDGGYLVAHTDFHQGQNRALYRRLNLLLYLNDGWLPENQGALELWDKAKDVVAREVLPALGRCVIFYTDDQSMHGFSKPVTGRTRNSVALYYYTAYPPEQFSGSGVTFWRVRGLAGDKNQTWASIQLRRLLLFISHTASSIAWRAARKAAGVAERVDKATQGRHSPR